MIIFLTDQEIEIHFIIGSHQSQLLKLKIYWLIVLDSLPCAFAPNINSYPISGRQICRNLSKNISVVRLSYKVSPENASTPNTHVCRMPHKFLGQCLGLVMISNVQCNLDISE